MKKRWLLIPALALLFGGALALSITSVKVSQVRAEEIAEVVEEEKEEDSKYKELYEDAVNKIKELKNSQIVATIISVLSGGGLTLLMALGPMFVNRATINKAKSTADTASNQLDTTASNIAKLESDLNIKCVKIDEGVEKIEEASTKIKEFSAKLDSFEANQETIYKQQLEERQFFLAIIGSSKELVANGTAEALNKRFGK